MSLALINELENRKNSGPKNCSQGFFPHWFIKNCNEDQIQNERHN